MSDGRPDFPYVWTWRQRTWEFGGATIRAPWFGDGVDRVGRRCRVVCRDQGGRDEQGQTRMSNSALIAFQDGYEVVTSRGGLRKAR